MPVQSRLKMAEGAFIMLVCSQSSGPCSSSGSMEWQSPWLRGDGGRQLLQRYVGEYRAEEYQVLAALVRSKVSNLCCMMFVGCLWGNQMLESNFCAPQNWFPISFPPDYQFVWVYMRRQTLEKRHDRGLNCTCSPPPPPLPPTHTHTHKTTRCRQFTDL